MDKTKGVFNIKIKAVKEYENGFMIQPFAFGGEDGMENYDSSIKYRASIQNYLIDTGDEVILVDTGIPADFEDPEYDEDALIYNGERTSEYMDALKELGYEKEDITKILLTHKHLDHSGELGQFPNAEITDRPLNYDNLTKMNFCLRENGQSVVREATMFFETKIKNRRFAILFLLNLAFQNKTAVALSDIIDVLKEDKGKFVVSEEDLEETISSELEIAFMAGIPYIRRYMNGKLYLQPTKGLNLDELEVGAPQDVINFLNQYSY